MKKSIYLWLALLCVGPAVPSEVTLTQKGPLVQLRPHRMGTELSGENRILFAVKFIDGNFAEQVVERFAPDDTLIIPIRRWHIEHAETCSIRLDLEITLIPLRYESNVLHVEMNLHARSTLLDTYQRTIANKVVVRYRKLLDFGPEAVIEVGLHEIWPAILAQQSALLSRLPMTSAIAVSDSFALVQALIIKPVAVGAPLSSTACDTSAIESENSYDTWSEQELDDEFKTARYIATGKEIKRYKKLTIAEKRAFLKNFWQTRDQTPGTEQNEFKQAFMARVQTAAKAFYTQNRSGVTSDRGRVLLIYGYPDEVVRTLSFPNQSETWTYDSVQGGIRFVFVEKDGMGDMRLVHSTATGEISDPTWQRPNTIGEGPSIFIDYRYSR